MNKTTYPITRREAIEWCDLWVEAADGTPLPRVLLVGDSITRSYYPHVAESLRDKCACARIATSKCVGDPQFIRELDLVIHEYSFSVIHFNNGRHGPDYDEDFYAAGLAEAFDALVANCGAERLIWATSTPAAPDKEAGMRGRISTQRVSQRNRIAAQLAAGHGVTVNDLYAALEGRPDLYSQDGVHLNEEGRVVLGDRVVRHIQDRIQAVGSH